MSLAQAVEAMSLRTLATKLAAGSVRSHVLLSDLLRDGAQRNRELNAIVTLDDRAHSIAQSLCPSAEPRLFGVPFTVKDSLCTEGLRTTVGTPELRDYVPGADAVAVARLKAAGGVLFGKTNLPAWCTDIQSYNDLFGTTSNPYCLERTAGGSSGGSAAAVAAGLTAFDIGSDIGGSIRIPAHFCGICGHKPSYGLVPQKGFVTAAGALPSALDINVIGPLARRVDDLELVLDVLATPPGEEGGPQLQPLRPPRHEHGGTFHVGVWLDDPFCPVDKDSRRMLRRAATALADAGVHVHDNHPAVSLARQARLAAALIGAAAERHLPHGQRRYSMVSHARWLELDAERQQLRAVWRAWFQEYDALLCPVFPTAAFPHDHSEPIEARRIPTSTGGMPYLRAMAWCDVISALYLPATVVPVGGTEDGLPIGIQVVAPPFEDRTGLAVARVIEETLGDFSSLRGQLRPRC